MIEDFHSIASRDDAEAFAVTHGLSRAFVAQDIAPRMLGVWRGDSPCGVVRMTLRWFEPINLGRPRTRVNKATLQIGRGSVFEASYEDLV
jgi:hypothetical protein